MHPDRPSDRESEAAAKELHAWGFEHGWRPSSTNMFDALDPIRREGFEAIVERVRNRSEATRDPL